MARNPYEPKPCIAALVIPASPDNSMRTLSQDDVDRRATWKSENIVKPVSELAGLERCNAQKSPSYVGGCPHGRCYMLNKSPELITVPEDRWPMIRLSCDSHLHFVGHGYCGLTDENLELAKDLERINKRLGCTSRRDRIMDKMRWDEEDRERERARTNAAKKDAEEARRKMTEEEVEETAQKMEDTSIA
jgi:hypothetical protein